MGRPDSMERRAMPEYPLRRQCGFRLTVPSGYTPTEALAASFFLATSKGGSGNSKYGLKIFRNLGLADLRVSVMTSERRMM